MVKDHVPYSEIARQFSDYKLSVDSIERHARNHVLKVSKINADDPAALLRGIISQCSELAATCRNTNDARGAIDAVGKQLQAITSLVERERIQKEESTPVQEQGVTMADLDEMITAVERNYDPCPTCGARNQPKLQPAESDSELAQRLHIIT